MISSAIWNKQARVNISETNKSARVSRVVFVVFDKFKVLVYSKLHEKNHVIAY